MNLSDYPGLTQEDLNWCVAHHIQLEVVIDEDMESEEPVPFYKAVFYAGSKPWHATDNFIQPIYAIEDICKTFSLITPWKARSANAHQ